MADQILSEVFARVAELGHALGMRNIRTLPGCWELQVDDRWWIALNGHAEQVKASDGADVPAYSCWIKYNGWPAGIASPVGGIIAAGEGANEDTFIEALKTRTIAECGKVRAP